jgi:hypothetical protein
LNRAGTIHISLEITGMWCDADRSTGIDNEWIIRKGNIKDIV